MTALKSVLAAFLLGLAASAVAQENVVNIYSGRHYQTDEQLYSGFTKATGIKINRIEAGEDAIIERIRNEGARSPADVMITVDAGRLWRAEQLGLFQSVKSRLLESRIPESLREPSGHWFGFSTRARVIAYNKDKVRAGEIATYEQLADPKWKGRVCMRSSTNVYNLSLMGALIDQSRRGQGGSLGEGRARQPGAGPQGRRHRPAEGGRGGPLRRHGLQPVLLRAPRALGKGRRKGNRGQARHRAPQPVELGHAREYLGCRSHGFRAAQSQCR